MKRAAFAAVVLAAGFPIQALSHGALPRVSLEDATDAVAQRFMADRCHVGLSIVTRSGGRTSFHNYGSVSRAYARTPTKESVYELASVTKTFTGALAAEAVVSGKMGLDTDFRTYLPGRYPNLEFGGRPISLRSLATHTSGLQRDLPSTDQALASRDYDHIGEQIARIDRGYTRSRSLRALHSVTLRSRPGDQFAYSNIGVRVIGYGLEKTYGRPLTQLLQRSILGPLRMRDTGFSLHGTMQQRLVVAYSRNGRVQPYHDTLAGAAYGLYSTPADMARYLAWQLDRRDATIRRAHELLRGDLADGAALIWNVGLERGEPMLWHGGGTFGETSQIVLFPKSAEGFVLLANDACSGTESALKMMAVGIHERHLRMPP